MYSNSIIDRLISVKEIGHGENAADGDILFTSLVVPTGKKVIFIVIPKPNVDNMITIAGIVKLCSGNVIVVNVFGTVLSTDFDAPSIYPTKISAIPYYTDSIVSWTAGTYSNIKLYARNSLYRWDQSPAGYYDFASNADWVAFEMNDE